jgi:hypothetical protein
MISSTATIDRQYPIDVSVTALLVGLTASEPRSVGLTCVNWDGRRDRIHFFELRLVELPHLQRDNREVVEARLTSPVELERMTLTGLVAAYLSLRQPLCG